MKAAYLALFLATSAVAQEGTKWEISKVPANEKVFVDSYCLDGETFKGMAGEKQALIQDLEFAKSQNKALIVALGVVSVLAAGAGVALALKK